MEFNKIAAAILVTVLAVMVISKVGNYLVPTETTHATGPVDTGETGGPAEEEVAEGPFTDYLAEASEQRGQAVANNCLSCHTLNQGGAVRQGPNLYGIIGRDIGSEEDFGNYSSALTEAEGEWTYQKLFEYLKNPQDYFAGSQMYFRLADPVQRASVILYLRTLSDSPPALPEPTTPSAGDEGTEETEGAGEETEESGEGQEGGAE